MKLAEPEAEMLDQDVAPTPEEYNKYIGMGVLLPRRYGYQSSTLYHRNFNVDGELIGNCNPNPILYTMVY